MMGGMIPLSKVIACAVLVILSWTLTACRLAGEESARPDSLVKPHIISATDWGSKPGPIPDERKHEPVRITVHHAGVEWNSDDDPFKKIAALQSWGRRDKGWPDVPYHFLIAPDGRIFEGRDLRYQGETNTEYDTRGHALIQLWGNFETQSVTLAQLRAAVKLAAWLCGTRGIEPATIATHRDWSEQTACPGKNLYRYFQDGRFRGWVEDELGGGPASVEIDGH